MKTIDSTFKTEKNKKENSPIFLYTIYNFDGNNTDLFFAEHEEDVHYDGKTYVKFPLTHDFVGNNSSGEIDTITITLCNISRLMQSYLEDYDFRNKKVSIRMVWANQLADTDAYIEDVFYIDSYTADEKNVAFALTSKLDILDIEIPCRMYLRNFCSWKFKSSECGYTGGETTCNKTLNACRGLSNQERFGGFPSVPSKRIYGYSI